MPGQESDPPVKENPWIGLEGYDDVYEGPDEGPELKQDAAGTEGEVADDKDKKE